MASSAVVCVASNSQDATAQIKGFLLRLRSEIDPATRHSTIYVTPSITDGVTLYHNLVASFSTEMSAQLLTYTFKQWEIEAGRSHSSSVVTLDIDLVIFNGEILRPHDYSRDYFRIGYRQLL